MEISNKIRENFPQLSTLQDQTRTNLFAGRDLPAFMQAYLLMRFTVADTGVIDEEGLKEYLSTKMTNDAGLVRSKLLAGEKVNLTCRFYVKSDLQEGMTAFTIADIELGSHAYILQSIVDDNKDSLCDGENWGNITMEYVWPEGKRKGYVNMISYRPFRPLQVDLDYYAKARQGFTLQEWVDAIVASMGYNPDAFIGADEDDTMKKKLEFCSRLLIAIEPRVNIIELGPKGTGKSYCYNNNSKYLWLHVNGGTTRAEMFYNRLTRQYGPLKTHDGLGIDEVTTFDIKDNEVRSMLKGYLEAGKAAIGKVTFASNCGICLLGNIPLSEQMLPYGTDYYRYLPGIFRESALMDRFHGFIQGWMIPRLSVGSIYEGWAINMEYLSEIMHSLRTCPEYGKLFDEIVSYAADADLRDVKAVKKLATAYAKLLFPHIKTLSNLSDADKQEYIEAYEKYCLAPAIEKRGIIRLQCHLLDKEYQQDMPLFYVEGPEVSATEKDLNDGSEEALEKESDSVEINESEMSESKIYVHSIFLSEGEFKDGEKARRMQLIEDAERWIVQQAVEYGKKVEFVNGTTGLEGETIHASTPKDVDCPDCTGTDGNYYLGLSNEHFNIEELLYTMKEVGCDKAALLVIVDANGRSFSGWNGKGNEFMGTAVVYGDDGLELQSGVVAHELLHLFGADDLYAPMQNEEAVAFLREHYANEVMFQDHASAETLTISPYTAWRIGWAGKKEDWFDIIVSQDER